MLIQSGRQMTGGINPEDVEPLEIIAALHKRVVEMQQHLVMVRQIVDGVKIETEMQEGRIRALEKKFGNSECRGNDREEEDQPRETKEE